MNKKLRLDLDDVFDEYIYTEYDIGGEGHSVTINEKDKEKFLDAISKEFRDRVKEALCEDDEEDG